MFPDANFDLFPMSNPGIVSIPAGFLLAVIGTYIGGRRKENAAKQAEMEVRSLTGVGVEKAVSH
jgi:cation/acetate symporter